MMVKTRRKRTWLVGKVKVKKKRERGSYSVYSILIFAWGKCEIAAKASFDMRRLLEQGEPGQESTTFTSMLPPLHGLFFPLMHLILYLLPHAAPLSHNPSFTATNRFPGGNCPALFPPQAVAACQNKHANTNNACFCVSFFHCCFGSMHVINTDSY